MQSNAGEWADRAAIVGLVILSLFAIALIRFAFLRFLDAFDEFLSWLETPVGKRLWWYAWGSAATLLAIAYIFQSASLAVIGGLLAGILALVAFVREEW